MNFYLRISVFEITWNKRHKNTSMKFLPKFLKSQGAMSCLNKRIEACVFPALSFVGASLYLSFLLLIISKIHVLAYCNPTNNRKMEFFGNEIQFTSVSLMPSFHNLLVRVTSNNNENFSMCQKHWIMGEHIVWINREEVITVHTHFRLRGSLQRMMRSHLPDFLDHSLLCFVHYRSLITYHSQNCIRLLLV